MRNNVGLNGDNSSETREAQQQKCENPMTNTTIQTIFGKLTYVVDGLLYDQLEEAKAIMAKVTRQGQGSLTWLQKHHE